MGSSSIFGSRSPEASGKLRIGNYGYADAIAGFRGSNAYAGVVSEKITCTSPSVSKNLRPENYS
jgi:hypothetical protein